jgi:hypothetical protein
LAFSILKRLSFPARPQHFKGDLLIWIIPLDSLNYSDYRVHKIAYGFDDPSEKMSVLINFLLQNTNFMSVLSKICPNFVGHVWQDWQISRNLWLLNALLFVSVLLHLHKRTTNLRKLRHLGQKTLDLVVIHWGPWREALTRFNKISQGLIGWFNVYFIPQEQ